MEFDSYYFSVRMSFLARFRWSFVIWFTMVSAVGIAQDLSPFSDRIALEELEGIWYVNQTDFPMWLKGKRTHPQFRYTVRLRKEVKGLYDVVAFQKKGKEKTIEGFDTPQNADHTLFEWRGKGWKRLLKSDWRILHYDRERQWLLIYFSGTLFTPEGFDVISKKKQLDQGQRAALSTVLKSKNLAPQLTTLDQ